MNMPEHYKNLDIDHKRIIVVNIISQYGNKRTQEMVDNLNNEVVEFLFKYFFTESKEQRERMWYDMQKRYELTLKEIEHIAKKIQMLNLEYREFLASQSDVKEFSKNKKSK